MIDGLIIERDKPHPNMPTAVKGAKIALVKCSLDPLTPTTTDWSREYKIKNPDQLKGFIEGERNFLRNFVRKAGHAGVNVLFCRKRISKSMLRCFADHSILALNLVGEKDLTMLARATGAKIVADLGGLDWEDLGTADVEFRKVSGDEMLFIDCCREPKATSILIRGCLGYVVEETERVVRNCVKAVAAVVEDRRVVAGGGAVEMELVKELKKYSIMFKGKEQLAVEAFAEAVQTIPETLAANAGLNPLDILVELRSGHAKGYVHMGVNMVERKVGDVLEKGLLEPFKVKNYAIQTATKAAIMILRIDDVMGISKPGKREEKELEKERARITDEKLRKLFREEEELQQVDRDIRERMIHSETR